MTFEMAKLPPVHISFSNPLPKRMSSPGLEPNGRLSPSSTAFARLWEVARTYGRFVGPGFMISVAYIDPGNYATDLAAGASHRFKLLFVVLLSNIFAVFLQSLCIHLGAVTGMNLAQMLRVHCHWSVNWISYVFAEAAIILTDLAEVLGTGIAINLLSNGRIPLWGSCLIGVLDVLFILAFYREAGAAKTAGRLFEYFVAALVLAVAACFSVQLSYIRGVSVGEVFEGYIPSHTLVKGNAMYQSCGILGATVMPHSLYLGSGLVQGRMQEFDEYNGTVESSDEVAPEKQMYRPSLQAIKQCKTYAIAELTVSLVTFAFFINSAILIVGGAQLFGITGADKLGLPGIYHLLSNTIDPAVGKLFAVALLFSGLSAGIVCTLAGQMVSEGQTNFRWKAWQRRIFTRVITITPSIIVAVTMGQAGVNKALVASQVGLSVALPFISAPLIWFTIRRKYMTVTCDDAGIQRPSSLLQEPEETGGSTSRQVDMRLHYIVAIFAVLVWAAIAFMNGAMLVFTGKGEP